VGAIAAEAIGGPRLRQAVSVLVALALFTSISAMVMAGPRVYARMAEDGLFPRFFRPGRDVPGRAVAFQVGLAILVLWYSDLARLLGYIGFTLGLSAAATVVGLIAMRLREGRERVPIPGYPWIPGLFVFVTLGTAGFMVLRQPGEAVAGLLTVAAGVPLYFAIASRRS
jgi:APA family basic amino acid/polyamine antiporter